MKERGTELNLKQGDELEYEFDKKDWPGMDTPEMLLNIQAKMHSLNPAQKKVAAYVVDNYHKLEGMTSKELANLCGVSEPTVTRFVKEMGYENYRWFQLNVAKVHMSNKKGGYSRVSDDDSVEVVCHKIIEDNLRSVAALAKTLDYGKLEKAKEWVIQSRNILILAQGRSVVTAYSLKIRLFRLGFNCLVYNDPHTMAVATSLAQGNDLVIGISTYGRTKDVVEGLVRARQRGCKTIGVTSYRGVPIEEASELVLHAIDVDSGDFGFEPTGATVAQMVLLDCLYMLVALQTKERSQMAIQETYESLHKLRM